MQKRRRRVLERAGHTEGSVDLARLAGCSGAAVICEIMNEDGSMARMPDLVKLADTTRCLSLRFLILFNIV